jgi:hypothetical protein
VGKDRLIRWLRRPSLVVALRLALPLDSVKRLGIMAAKGLDVGVIVGMLCVIENSEVVKQNKGAAILRPGQWSLRIAAVA